MKLTRSQLRRLILETLKEGTAGKSAYHAEAEDTLSNDDEASIFGDFFEPDSESFQDHYYKQYGEYPPSHAEIFPSSEEYMKQLRAKHGDNDDADGDGRKDADELDDISRNMRRKQ